MVLLNIHRRNPRSRGNWRISLIQKNAEVIAALKSALKQQLDIQAAQRRAIFRQSGSVNGHEKNPKDYNNINTGDCLKARNYDAKQTTKNINLIIQQLAKFGVKADRDRSGGVSFKNVNEGGQINMVYDVTKLKQMKLETYQENAAGNITKEATDYLLKYFDVMIEAAKGEDVNVLAMDYVAACKAGDDAKKTELKEKISAVSDCKNAKEELKALREKLSDREKAFVDDLDAEICGEKDTAEGDPEEPVQESGEETGGETGGSPETQKAVDDTVKSAEDLEKKIEKGAKKAGDDNKEAFDQLLSAASESAISDTGREAMVDYITESVAVGEMDADEAMLLTTLMSM